MSDLPPAETAPAAADPQEETRKKRASPAQAGRARDHPRHWRWARPISGLSAATSKAPTTPIPTAARSSFRRASPATWFRSTSTDNQFVKKGQVAAADRPAAISISNATSPKARWRRRRRSSPAQQYGVEVAQKNFPALLAQAQAQLATAKATLGQGAGRLRPPALAEQARDVARRTSTRPRRRWNRPGAGGAGRGAGLAGLARAAADRRDREAGRPVARRRSSRRRRGSIRPSSICPGRRSRRRRTAGSPSAMSRWAIMSRRASRLFAIVSPERWVTANFKENQLDRMRPGQKVAIEVDAYPRLKLRRPCRQHPARLGLEIHRLSAGERHRQFRQGGAARAGQDRHRQRPRSRTGRCRSAFRSCPTVSLK